MVSGVCRCPKWSESHSVVSSSLRSHGLYSPWNSPGQNTGVCSLSLLQWIFLTQKSNWGLLHCRQILYQLSYQGSPVCVCVCKSSTLLPKNISKMKYLKGTSLAVQWLRLRTSAAGAVGLIPCQETKIPQAMWSRPKKKKCQAQIKYLKNKDNGAKSKPFPLSLNHKPLICVGSCFPSPDFYSNFQFFY